MNSAKFVTYVKSLEGFINSDSQVPKNQKRNPRSFNPTTSEKGNTVGQSVLNSDSQTGYVPSKVAEIININVMVHKEISAEVFTLLLDKYESDPSIENHLNLIEFLSFNPQQDGPNPFELVEQLKGKLPAAALFHLRGCIYQRSGLHEAAIKEFKASLELDLNNIVAWRMTVESYGCIGKLQEKLDELSLEFIREPKNLFVLLQIAMLNLFGVPGSNPTEDFEFISLVEPNKYVNLSIFATALFLQKKRKNKDAVEILQKLSTVLKQEENPSAFKLKSSLYSSCLYEIIEIQSQDPSKLFTFDVNEELIQSIDQYLVRHPNDDKIWLKKSTHYRLSEKFDLCLSTAKEAVRLYPWNFSGWVNIAQAQFKSGHYPEALHAAKEAIRFSFQAKGSLLSELHDILGNIYFVQKEHAKAAWSYHMAEFLESPVFPPKIEYAVSIYLSSTSMEATSKVIELTQAILAKSPRSLQAHKYQALAYQRANSPLYYKSLLNYLDAAYSLENQEIYLDETLIHHKQLAHEFLIDHYLQKKNYKECLDHLNAILKILPNDLVTLSNRLKIQAEIKDAPACERDIALLLKLYSEDLACLEVVATSYYVLGKYDESKKYLSLIEGNPKHTSMGNYYSLRARFYLKAGDNSEEVQRLLEKAIELECDDIDVMKEYLGDTYLFNKQLNKAVEIYSSVSCKDEGVYLGRGNAYALLKQYDLAVEDLNAAQKCCGLTPHIAKAWEYLFTLRNNPEDLIKIQSLLKNDSKSVPLLLLYADLSIVKADQIKDQRLLDAAELLLGKFIKDHPSHEKIKDLKKKFELLKQKNKGLREADLALAEAQAQIIMGRNSRKKTEGSKDHGVIEKCKKMPKSKKHVPVIPKQKFKPEAKAKPTAVEKVEFSPEEELGNQGLKELHAKLKELESLEKNSDEYSKLKHLCLATISKLFTSTMKFPEQVEDIFVDIAEARFSNPLGLTEFDHLENLKIVLDQYLLSINK